MKDYLKKLRKIIKSNGKAKVAVMLDVQNTTTIDRWLSRSMIPSKYLDDIKSIYLKEQK